MQIFDLMCPLGLHMALWVQHYNSVFFFFVVPVVYPELLFRQRVAYRDTNTYISPIMGDVS